MNALSVATKALMRSRDWATSVLTVLSFALPHAMLLAVSGGIGAFVERQHTLFIGEENISGLYIFLAIFAGILLIVPILSMGAAASRLGMNRRSRDLAVLRLIGLPPATTRIACVVDTVIHALVGAVIGSVLYVVTLPAWSLLSFQNAPLSISEMWVGVVGLVAEMTLMAVLAALSSWIAVRRTAITPLGVLRSQEPNRVSKRLVIGVVVLILVWLFGGGLLNVLPEAIAMMPVFVMLACIFAGVNVLGAWSIDVMGRLMARFARRPHMLIAGRRLADDPKSVWRSFGAVALVGFIAGCMYPVSVAINNQLDDLVAVMVVGDIRTGMLLTLGMTVALAAVSTAVNQATRLVDTMNEVRALTRAGAPMSVLDRARRAEILVPATLIIGGAVSIGLVFILPLVAMPQSTGVVDGIVHLAIFLVSSIIVIVVASEATRPMRSRLLAENV